MVFGEPDNYGFEEIEILLEDWYNRLTEITASEVKSKLDDWFETGAELGETAPEEFEELLRFEERELLVLKY
jgi:hypothetical protein